MLGRQSSKRWGPALLLLAVGSTACRREQPAQPPPAPGPTSTGTLSRDSAFWVSGWSYYLRPIGTGKPTEADKSKQVWGDLFSGMSKDAKTRELLTRLHGGWPAEIVVVDAKQAKDQAASKAQPPDGVAVVLRVADLNLKEVKTKVGPVPFREVSYGLVIRMKDAAIAELPSGKVEPLPEEALSLAIEEYVLRHAPGWVARWGTGPSTNFADDEQLRRSAEEATLPANVEDQRRELDQKINDLANRSKDFYGATRKP